MRALYLYCFENKWSPFTFGRLLGESATKKWLNNWLDRRGKLTDEQREILVEYLYSIFMLDGTTEYAIMVMFDSSLHAVHPLHDKLAECLFPVSFIYGDRDWTKLID